MSNNLLLIGGAALGAAALAYFLTKKIKANSSSDVYVRPDSSVSGLDNTVSIPLPDGSDGVLGGAIAGGAIGGAVAQGKTPVIEFSFPDTQLEELKNGNALSQRAKNPGAVFWDGSSDWQGMDKSKTKKNQIIYFTDEEKGIRCCCMVLKNYKKKHGIDTLQKVFERYAPSGHGANNPLYYAEYIADKLRIGINDKIDLDGNRTLLAAVAYHIHSMEAGYYWLPRTLFIKWAKAV